MISVNRLSRIYLRISFLFLLLLLLPTTGCYSQDATVIPEPTRVVGVGAVLLLAAIIALGLFIFNRRWQTAVQERTADLQKGEERYRSIFDNSLDCILVADDKGYYVDANPAACTLLGYTREELLQTGVWAIDPVGDREAMQPIWQEFTAAGTQIGEYTLRCKDGTLVETEYRAVANFVPGLHLSSFQDITERKKTAAALSRSEKRYHIVSEVISDYAYAIRIGVDGVFEGEWVTDSFTQMTGYMPEELPFGESWMQIIHADDHEAIKRHFQRLLANQPVVTEFRLFTKDGEMRWARDHGRPVWDETAARVTRVYGAVQDITDRKQVEEKLRESESRHRLLFENAALSIGYYSPDGEIIAFNNVAAELLGGVPDEFVGFRIDDIFPGSVGQKYLRRIQQVMATEQSRTYEDKAELPTGTRWFLSTYTPMVDAQGVPMGVQIIADDITDRKQTEIALQESEELHRVTIENIADPIFITDDAGKFTYICPNTRQTLGYTTAEVAAMGRIQQLFGEPLVDVQTLTRQGEVRGIERTVSAKSGRPLTFLIDAKKVTIGKGTILYTCRDVTILQETAAALRESEASLRTLLNAIRDSVLLLTPDGRVIDCNRAFAVRFNQQREALLGSNAFDLLGDAVAKTRQQWVQKVIRTGKPVYFIDERDGRILDNSIYPVLDAAGAVVRLAVVGRDITEQRVLEKSIQRQERLAAIGQLAAGIAHDFNNILAVIALYAELTLNEARLTPDVRYRLHTIMDQTNKASGLIQQILDFGRKSILDRKPLALLPFLKEAVKLLQRTLPENILVRLVHGPDATFRVEADPTRIQQAILNLALNARDAMPGGGELRLELDQIQVAGESESGRPPLSPGEWIVLQVADTGLGIPEDVLPHIFEPFFTTKVPEGSGLGLAQVYGIVKQHKGEIDVTTTPDQGTQFTIYLPALAATVAASADQDVETPEGGGETILVVEDDDVIREAMEEAVAGLGYRVVTAVTGQEAIDTYEEEQIDLVLSDMVMPGMGGEALFYELKRRDPDVKMIIITGYHEQQALEKMQADGLADWLFKPLRLPELAQVLAQILQ